MRKKLSILKIQGARSLEMTDQ